MPHQPFTSILLVLLVTSFSTINQAFGQQHSMPKSLFELRHSPSPYECAILSAHAYHDNLQQGDPVLWKDPNSQQVHRIYGWTVAHVLTEDENDELLSKAFTQLGLPYGYKGVIYTNDQKQQCVLAHRGTDTKNMSALKTDVGSIAQNIIQGQEENMPRVLEQAIACAQEKNYSLTVTGHSLGGWLAQIAAFLAKVQYPEVHVKAITFDSPGARPMLEQINPRINPIPLDQIDITNYLSAPNLINACHPHVGSIYRIVFEAFQAKPALYTLQTHALSTLIQAFNPHTGDAYQCLQVNSWPVVSKKSLQLGKALVTGDKLQAVLALCQLLQRCIKQEALGEFSGFFKLAKQVNRYHPKGADLTSQDAFDLNYKYHYHTSPYTSHQLHIRHFPAHAQSFLKKLEVGAKPHVKLAEQAQWLQAIQWNQQKGWVTMPAETDLRMYCDQLISIVLDHPALEQAANLQLRAINNLLPPPAVSFFVGRKEKQRSLQQSLQTAQALVIAPPITGPGGIGKTQLALRVLHQQAERYDHVFWIPAESEQKLLDAYLRIAGGLGIYVDKKDLKQAVQTVRAYLKDQHCLYVFDDAPNITAIQDFLPLAQGHVLITSRNSNVSAWPIKPLLLDPLSEQEALALAQEFDYGQSEQEQEALQALLKQIPRYPLTLVQLFSTLEVEGYSPAIFLTAMEQYTVTAQEQALITLLNEQPHTRVEYGQSMVYVLKTSLERLAQEQQGIKALQLISQLAYLDPKGIPLDWLLTWDTVDTSPFKRKTRAALSLLEKYSLIQWDRPAQQVYLHAEMQLMVRHLYPQPTLADLISRLVDYVGDEEEALQNATRQSALLPHGRVLFERLATAQYPQTAYALTKYLVKACSVTCLLKEGLSWAERELQLAQQRYPGQDHPDIAQSLNNVGESLWHLGSYRKALEYYKQGLSMRQRLYQDQDHPDIAQSLNNVGFSLGELGRHQEALEYYKQGLSMRQKLYQDQDHPDIAQSLNNVGWSLSELGNEQEALTYIKEALAMSKRFYQDQDHPDIARYSNHVGYSLGELNRHQEALKYLKQALNIRQRLYSGHNHPYVAWSLDHLGYSLGELGSYQEALVYHKQALEILKHLYPDQNHPWTARVLYKMGKTLVRSGDYQEALTYSQEALAMQKRIYQDQDHPWMAQTLHSMGETLEGLGKFTQAATHYQQALCMALRIFKQEHPYITKYAQHLINALRQRKDPILIQQIKAEIIPLCKQWLGQDHTFTQQFVNLSNTS